MKKSLSTIAWLFIAVMAASPVYARTPEVTVCRYRNDKQAAVSLTYDDGVIDHYTMVAPVLESLGLRGSFWVVGYAVGAGPGTLTWDQCREMTERGHEISNHGWTHANLTQLSRKEIVEQITKCDDIIEKETGKRPITICYPYNAHNAVVDSIAMPCRVGARIRCVAQGQANNHATAEGMREWLARTIAEGDWGVTMTHGIKVGWDPWYEPQVLWDFYKELAASQDKVWIDTFAKVASYINERDNCKLEVKGRYRHVEITPTCTLDPALYKEKLTVRISNGKTSRLVELDPFGGPQKF